MKTDIRALGGAGLLGVFVASCFGLDSDAQWIFFAFGATWGGLWMQHE